MLDLKTEMQIDALEELKKVYTDKIDKNVAEINQIDVDIWKFEVQIEALKEIQEIANDYESIGNDFRNKMNRVGELKKKHNNLKNKHFLEEKAIIKLLEKRIGNLKPSFDPESE